MDFSHLEELKKKKYWHQLTDELEQFIDEHSGVDLTELYAKFVDGFDTYMNPMRWAKIVISIAKSTSDPVSFLAKIRQDYGATKKEMNESAYLLITLSLIQHLQFTDSGSLGTEDKMSSSSSRSSSSISLRGRELADQLLNEVKPLVEDRVGYVNPSIHLALEAPVEEPVLGLYHLVLAEKAQIQNDFLRFYHHMLQYLSRTPLSSIRLTTQQEIARSLSISALVSPDVYTFGELAIHPIMNSLKGSTDEWLYELITIFDQADPRKYAEFIGKHGAAMQQIPVLLANASALKDKLRVASFVSYVFSQPADHRIIPFSSIAASAMINEELVEFLVLKAFAAGLVKGHIDEIDRVVIVEDIKPRLLSYHQVSQLEKKVEAWKATASESLSFLHMQIEAAKL